MGPDDAAGSLTRSQRLLLSAALDSDEQALESWSHWCRDFPLDDIDNDSFWILPLLYRNLEDLDFSGPERNRLKGIYK